MRRIGYLGSCPSPYCGGIHGYFCMKCRHYVTTCRCGFNEGGCQCEEEDYGMWWAGQGDQRMKELELAKANSVLDTPPAGD